MCMLRACIFSDVSPRVKSRAPLPFSFVYDDFKSCVCLTLLDHFNSFVMYLSV